MDVNGIPLALRLTAANWHDSKEIVALVNTVPPVRQCAGRPRRPAKLHADKGYDVAPVRRALRRRGITPRIARRGMDTGQRLVRHRWAVERTLAWFSRYRRLVNRCGRRADIVSGFRHRAAGLICWRVVQRWLY